MKGLIIVWGAALHKLDVITAVIESEVSIMGIRYQQWKPGIEFDALKEFYNKSDEIIRFKMKGCSTSKFVCFEIEHKDDESTVLHRNELLRVVSVPYHLKIMSMVRGLVFSKILLTPYTLSRQEDGGGMMGRHLITLIGNRLILRS